MNRSEILYTLEKPKLSLKKNKIQLLFPREIFAEKNFISMSYSIRRVENNIGPQTRPNYLNTLDKLMVPIQRKNSGPYSYMLKKEKNQTLFSSEESSMLKYPAILERIENIEELLSVPESRVDVFQRLKVIEDRLLSLESISPEYVHCQVKQSQNKKSTDTFEFGEAKKKTTGFLIHEKKPYSVGKISSIIHSCEKRKNFKY